MKKTIIYSAVAMLLGASAANATVSGSVMRCNAHDWQRFADAVERQDQAALEAMAAEPELRVCEFYRTIVTLVPRPRLLPPLTPIAVPIDSAAGPFPGQAPGGQLGRENDGGGGDNGGGSANASSSSSAPSAAPERG